MATAKGKRQSRAAEQYLSYALLVDGWDCHYSLRGSDPKSRWDPGPYSEISTITFSGEFIRPTKPRFGQGIVTLSARAGMLLEEAQAGARAIGSLRAGADNLEAYVFIPAEQTAALTSLAGTGRLQIIRLWATKLRYRSGKIYSISLDTSYSEDDL